MIKSSYAYHSNGHRGRERERVDRNDYEYRCQSYILLWKPIILCIYLDSQLFNPWQIVSFKQIRIELCSQFCPKQNWQSFTFLDQNRKIRELFTEFCLESKKFTLFWNKLDYDHDIIAEKDFPKSVLSFVHDCKCNFTLNLRKFRMKIVRVCIP